MLFYEVNLTVYTALIFIHLRVLLILSLHLHQELAATVQNIVDLFALIVKLINFVKVDN